MRKPVTTRRNILFTSSNLPFMNRNVDDVLGRLKWMRDEHIWPIGLRYLWTDAFGVTLLVSLNEEFPDGRFLYDAKWVASEVNRVLGRPAGIRIGEQPDRDGQYFHYLLMWMFALARLGEIEPAYRRQAVDLARAVHRRFVVPGVGTYWKMLEDLSGPYPGFGFGALDAFHASVVYRLLAPHELGDEIEQVDALVERSYRQLRVTQDLGLGMLLWMTHFCPTQRWAITQRNCSLAMLERMWIDPPGYFCREPSLPNVKFAFTNYGVSIGLQAVGEQAQRVERVREFFWNYRSGDSYERDAITHVMGCCALFPGRLLQTETINNG